MISSSFDFPAVAIMNAPPNKIHFVAIFGIENAAAHFQDSRAKIHSKAAIHTKMNCFSGIARGFRPHKASAAQAVAAFFTRLFYHRQKALSSTFYAFCGKNMNQLLQSHFVRQLPQGGSLWQYGQLFGCARASLREKDFPRPGRVFPQRERLWQSIQSLRFCQGLPLWGSCRANARLRGRARFPYASISFPSSSEQMPL